jgi:hypothetical protein
MAVGEKDQRGIPMTLSANSDRRVDELVYFLGRQVLPRAPFTVRDTP